MSSISSPPAGHVRLVPLGGLGEVGMNCLAVEQAADIVVVDCGIRFPWDQLGVDVVRPDFSWLEERRDRVRAVFLTHGHEDHIGGLPYLLRSVKAPVFGPPHALGLVRARLAEHEREVQDSDLRIATPRSEYALGSFVIEPIRVAHSIVEATALRIETAAGTVVHTGDFNFDPDPPDGEPTDEKRLDQIAEQGVSLLLSDSTNIDVAGPGGSERSVGRALEEIVRGAANRVFIALFASNIQRLIMLGDIAVATGRKICALGRSLETQITVATEIGRLHWPSNLRIRPDELRAAPRDKVLVLAGGTQGEPASAMARLATNQHQDAAIEPDDTVIFSSRAIPGNERAVVDMVGDVLRRGALVVTRMTNSSVHTSGHATREEQTRMLDLIRPHSFMPVHGTLHHLTRHAALARERGVSDVIVVENGDSVLFDGSTLSREGKVQSGSVPVGLRGVSLDPATLRQRADLARYGIASVAIAVGRKGELLSPPSVIVRGIAGLSEPAALRPLEREIARIVESARKERRKLDAVREELRRVVKKKLLDVGGTRPVVEIHVLETDD